jgi:hypothetical protein
VTLGASRTTEENGLPILGIARQGRGSGLALKKPNILDQRLSRGSIKGAERRHPCRWNSIDDDLGQRRIAASLRLRRRGNVRRALAAATVDTVAPCAPILKNLAAIGNRPV